MKELFLENKYLHEVVAIVLVACIWVIAHYIMSERDFRVKKKLIELKNKKPVKD